MSNLEQLREEFEAALDHWQSLRIGNRLTYRDVFECADVFPPDYVSFIGPDPEAVTLGLAARRYIIARDFNVFDPITSDMLWKLQNGGAA